jgi:hypothetical protein
LTKTLNMKDGWGRINPQYGWFYHADRHMLLRNFSPYTTQAIPRDAILHIFNEVKLPTFTFKGIKKATTEAVAF